MKSIDEIIGYVKKDETSAALDLMEEYFTANQVGSDKIHLLVLLKSRLERLKTNLNRGTDTPNDLNIEKNKINSAIIDMLLNEVDDSIEPVKESKNFKFFNIEQQSNSLMSLLEFRAKSILLAIDEINEIKMCKHIPDKIKTMFIEFHNENINAVSNKDFLLSHEITTKIHVLLRDCDIDMCRYHGTPAPIIFGNQYMFYDKKGMIKFVKAQSISELMRAGRRYIGFQRLDFVINRVELVYIFVKRNILKLRKSIFGTIINDTNR